MDIADEVSEHYAAIYRHCHPRYTVALGHQAVRVLQIAGEGPVTVQAVCAELECAPNTASEIIGRLAAKKLVVKSRRQDDERIVEIKLTRSGHRILTEQTGLNRKELSAKLAVMRENDRNSILEGLKLLLSCVKGGK